MSSAIMSALLIWSNWGTLILVISICIKINRQGSPLNPLYKPNLRVKNITSSICNQSLCATIADSFKLSSFLGIWIICRELDTTYVLLLQRQKVLFAAPMAAIMQDMVESIFFLSWCLHR